MLRSLKQLLFCWILNATPSSSQTYRLSDRHPDEACLIQVNVRKALQVVEVIQSSFSFGEKAPLARSADGNTVIQAGSQAGQLQLIGPHVGANESLGEQEVTTDAWTSLGLSNMFLYTKRLAADWTLSFEWVMFSIWAALFVSIQWFRKIRPHMGLIVWLLLAAIYYTLVSMRLGDEAGASWLTGYALECMCAFENIFVFHVITSAFQAPRVQVRRAIRLTIGAQVVMQAVLFAGLAERLPSSRVLSIMLGLWLIYLGTQAAREEIQSSHVVEDSWIVRCLQDVLDGERFEPSYAENGAMFVRKCGKICCTMLFPLVLSLILADFCFEINGTRRKFQEFDNHYVAFTSSAVAGFAMPDLFLLAQDLCGQFHLLTYGTSFALLLLGMQRLLNGCLEHRVPALLTCGMIGLISAICIAASWLSGPNATQGRKESAQRENEAVRLAAQPRVVTK